MTMKRKGGSRNVARKRKRKQGRLRPTTRKRTMRVKAT